MKINHDGDDGQQRREGQRRVTHHHFEDEHADARRDADIVALDSEGIGQQADEPLREVPRRLLHPRKRTVGVRIPDHVFDQAGSGDWKAASASLGAMTAAWERFRAGEVPPRLDDRMMRALERLARAVDGRDSTEARLAAIGVGQSSLDLQLRHRPPSRIDRERFELWARQLPVDVSARDVAGVRGDLATLEWIRDRFANTLDQVDRTRIDTHLSELRTKVTDGDLRGAAAEAVRLGDTLAGLPPA